MINPSKAESPDLSMLELFRAEVETHTQALNEGLLALEKDPGQARRIDGLMRAAHSIKGAARIVGIEAAGAVAHEMENCLVAAQEGQLTLTPAVIDVLLRGVDHLTRLSQDLAAGDGPPDRLSGNLGHLVAALAAVRAGALVPVRPVASSMAVSAVALDPSAIDRLRAELVKLLERGVPTIRIDLAGLADLEPLALALLSAFAQHAAQRQPPAELELAGARSEVRTLLHLTGLDRCYRLVDEEAEA